MIVPPYASTSRFRDRQPQIHNLQCYGRVTHITAVKPFEDVRQFRIGDSRTGILDFDTALEFPFERSRNSTRPPTGLKRIAFSNKFDQTSSRSSGSARMALRPFG